MDVNTSFHLIYQTIFHYPRFFFLIRSILYPVFFPPVPSRVVLTLQILFYVSSILTLSTSMDFFLTRSVSLFVNVSMTPLVYGPHKFLLVLRSHRRYFTHVHTYLPLSLIILSSNLHRLLVKYPPKVRNSLGCEKETHLAPWRPSKTRLLTVLDWDHDLVPETDGTLVVDISYSYLRLSSLSSDNFIRSLLGPM